MPTLLQAGRYRFAIVMADCDEPPHVHVSSAGGACKLWLHPISIARRAGFSEREQRAIMRIAYQQQAVLLERWEEACRLHE